MENFFRTVSQFTHLSAESKQEFSESLKKLKLPKGYMLLRQDTICNYLYYVDTGLVRTFYLKDGKDVTDWFSVENTFASSPISFINRQPDRRAIELVEPSIILSIHYNDMEDLCSKHHDIETFFRRFVSSGLVQVLQRIDALHFSTALQRYKSLMATHPGIIQRVPLGMIASYIGITQATLSRIRSQI